MGEVDIGCDCPKRQYSTIKTHYDLCASTPIFASMCTKKSPGMISDEIRTARLGKPIGRWVRVRN